MDKHKEVYIVCDIESTGPCPGLGSMLSLGMAAMGWHNGNHEWQLTHTFSANLKEIDKMPRDPETMAFWGKNPLAWEKAVTDAQHPLIAMVEFQRKLAEIRFDWPTRKLEFVGAPAGFDFPFVRYYMLRYLQSDAPFGHSCIDMKTLASERLHLPYRESGKSNYKGSWKDAGFPHTHVAVEDAIEQAHMFTRILDDSN